MTAASAHERRLIRIVKALGLKPEHVKNGSVSLSPHNDGWLLQWQGVAFLPGDVLSQITTDDVTVSIAERDALAAVDSSHDGAETHD